MNLIKSYAKNTINVLRVSAGLVGKGIAQFKMYQVLTML